MTKPGTRLIPIHSVNNCIAVFLRSPGHLEDVVHLSAQEAEDLANQLLSLAQELRERERTQFRQDDPEYQKYLEDLETDGTPVMCMQGTKEDYLEPSTPHMEVEILAGEEE